MSQVDQDCIDFGHDWETEDEYYLGTHVRTCEYCTYCGKEREDG